MNRRTALFAAAAVACGAIAAVLPGPAAAKAASPHYYLALGDSLSQGMQPDLQGVTRNTKEGYANDPSRSSAAAFAASSWSSWVVAGRPPPA